MSPLSLFWKFIFAGVIWQIISYPILQILLLRSAEIKEEYIIPVRLRFISMTKAGITPF